jgi:hypothetical protein
LGPTKVEILGPTPSNGLRNGFPPIQIPYVQPYEKKTATLEIFWTRDKRLQGPFRDGSSKRVRSLQGADVLKN